jgi:biotin operon repressor
MSKQLTKEDIREIITLWDSITVKQLAEKIGVSEFTIYSVAKTLRTHGVHIPSKRRKNILQGLVKEVISEMNSPLPS